MYWSSGIEAFGTLQRLDCCGSCQTIDYRTNGSKNQDKLFEYLFKRWRWNTVLDAVITETLRDRWIKSHVWDCMSMVTIVTTVFLSKNKIPHLLRRSGSPLLTRVLLPPHLIIVPEGAKLITGAGWGSLCKDPLGMALVNEAMEVEFLFVAWEGNCRTSCNKYGRKKLGTEKWGEKRSEWRPCKNSRFPSCQSGPRKGVGILWRGRRNQYRALRWKKK